MEKFTSGSKCDTKIKSTVNVFLLNFRVMLFFRKNSNCKILRGNVIKVVGVRSTCIVLAQDKTNKNNLLTRDPE